MFFSPSSSLPPPLTVLRESASPNTLLQQFVLQFAPRLASPATLVLFTTATVGRLSYLLAPFCRRVEVALARYSLAPLRELFSAYFLASPEGFSSAPHLPNEVRDVAKSVQHIATPIIPGQRSHPGKPLPETGRLFVYTRQRQKPQQAHVKNNTH